MEEEGIFYFFKQTDDKHTLVLGDQSSAFERLRQSGHRAVPSFQR